MRYTFAIRNITKHAKSRTESDATTHAGNNYVDTRPPPSTQQTTASYQSCGSHSLGLGNYFFNLMTIAFDLRFIVLLFL